MLQLTTQSLDRLLVRILYLSQLGLKIFLEFTRAFLIGGAALDVADFLTQLVDLFLHLIKVFVHVLTA